MRVTDNMVAAEVCRSYACVRGIRLHTILCCLLQILHCLCWGNKGVLMWYAVMSFCCALLNRVVKACCFLFAGGRWACTDVCPDARTVQGLLQRPEISTGWTEPWLTALLRGALSTLLQKQRKSTEVISLLSERSLYLAQSVSESYTEV